MHCRDVDLSRLFLQSNLSVMFCLVFYFVIPALSRNLCYISLCFIYFAMLNITFSNCRVIAIFISGCKV
jgi:hypothetical protein